MLPPRRKSAERSGNGPKRRGAGRRFIQRLAALSLWRLVAVFTLLGLLPLALLTYYSISISNATVRREVKARIRAATTVSAELVEQEMRGVQTLVESYANRPLLIEAMRTSSDSKNGDVADPKQVSQQIHELRIARPGISVTFVSDPTGRLIDIDPTTPSIVGEDFSFRDWYKGVRKTNRPYVSEVYRSAATGRPWVTAVAAPIASDSGEDLGILVAAYGADELQAFVEHFERSQGVSLTISDQNGVPVVDSGTSQGDAAAFKKRAIDAALEGSSGTLEITDQGADALIAYSPVERVGWTVTATTPNSTAFASVSRLQTAVLVSGGLVGLALIAQLVLLGLTLHEHRTAAKRLRDSEEASRMIVEAAGEAFVSINDQGLITGWNRRSEEVFGWSRAEALGTSLTETIIPERYKKAHDHGIQQYLGTGEGPVLNQRIELSALHRDGNEFPIDLLIWPLESMSRTSFNAFVQDITERKQAQSELAAARDEAVAASRFKSEFLANMSHEIRTPMNAVIGMTGLLLDDTTLTVEQRDYAETVRSSAEALLVIINDILDFSKIEAGAMRLEMVDFAPEMIVENVAELLASTAHEKSLELVTWIEPDVPPGVRGDAGRLRQILTNLVGNAIKFTHDGEVSIIVKSAKSSPEGALLRFEVTDTGIGIADDKSAGLFEAFRQADESTTRRYGGSGLGLAICKRLVDLMGGQIGVDSEPGKGSTFWFTAPFETRPVPEPRVPGWDLHDLSALIVDDSEINRHILTRQLAAWGIAADEAEGAGAALALLRHKKNGSSPYDLVIVDEEMPEMDGIALAAAIRETLLPDDLVTLAILLMTSSGHRPSLEEMQSAGIAATMTKPVRQSQLFDFVVGLRDTSGPGEREAVSEATDYKPPSNLGPILVAEDNPANQKVVRAMLKKIGYRADLVGNGLEAVDAAERIRYAAIVMDCQMPEMDGYRATSEIRKREPRDSRVPIIALTASAMKGDREKALAAGMDDYITKPVRLDELAQVLGRWTSRGSSTRSAAEAAPPEPPATALSPILDNDRISYLETECGDELTTELMESFLDHAPDNLTALRTAVESDDAGGIERSAHHLKGSSGNIGAARMEALCGELEAMGRSGAVSEAAELLARLERGFEEVGPALVAVNAAWRPSGG